MISKTRYTSNLHATIQYIMNPKKSAHIVLHKGIYSTNDLNQVIKDFNLQSQLRPNLKTKGIHIPLSFHIKDKVKVEKHGEKILKDWLNHMEQHGYKFDQFIIAQHHDKDNKNPHFHLLANLVMDNGQRANIAKIGVACKQTSKAITEKWKLTPANHRKSSIVLNYKDNPMQFSYNHVHKPIRENCPEQINIHDPILPLVDLLFAAPITSHACSGAINKKPKKNDEDVEIKKKYKRKRK